MATPASPAERALIASVLWKVERELREAEDQRTKMMLGISVGQAAINFMVENFGYRKTWEWLQREADNLMKQELP